jgi:hypothetical protein
MSTLNKEKKMGKYESAARRIAEAMHEAKSPGKGIRTQDIPGIIGCGGEVANCYPGIPGSVCCREAFFVSLTSKQYVIGKGHLSFRGAIELVVKHMQGPCKGITKVAIIIADSWDPSAYSEWQANIEQIKSEALVEAYLIVEGRTTLVSI